ncbi:MAG: DMT family transporter, partial [Thermoanaerobaculia bacterium]|nr:DMT family transporter [Thermoanaerobaculia bacterium]
VKIATRDLPGSQVAMIRFLVALVPLLLVPSIRRAAMTIARFRPLLLRGLFGGAAVLLFFSAIREIPVGVATLLNTTAPVFSGIFAAIFLGERLRARVLFPLLVTSSGIFMVVTGHSTPHEFLGFGLWELVALCSALCAAAAVTAMRGARRTEGVWATVSALSLAGLLATGPLAILHWTPPGTREWILMILAALFGLTGQLLMTWAYRWVETLIAGVIHQFTVIVAMSLGVIFLHDELNALILGGTSLTIVGVISVIALSRHRSQDVASAAPGGSVDT